MNAVFEDTSYYLALLNPDDEYAAAAAEYTAGFAGRIVTTAWVLTELANFLAHGYNRSLFLSLLDDLRGDGRVTIIEPTQDWFEQGLALFARRPDKDWSLTDCISFAVTQREGLTEALTADRHFEQAGFTVLLRRD